MPILPMVLVNGSEGIGTGWSTSIPNYNPRDIVNNIRRILKGEEPEEMHPWYLGFTGEIEVSGNSYSCNGVYEVIDDDTIRVSELPIRLWTQGFKEHLEACLIDAKGETPILLDYRDHSGDTTVDFTVKFENGVLDQLLKNNTLEKKMKLTWPRKPRLPSLRNWRASDSTRCALPPASPRPRTLSSRKRKPKTPKPPTTTSSECLCGT